MKKKRWRMVTREDLLSIQLVLDNAFVSIHASECWKHVIRYTVYFTSYTKRNINFSKIIMNFLLGWKPLFGTLRAVRTVEVEDASVHWTVLDVIGTYLGINKPSVANRMRK
uniref:Transposase n=1 Tax=Heterorhabditis bacteriophora TaxID=37862 RepID=A0A1I7WVM7_HETBA